MTDREPVGSPSRPDRIDFLLRSAANHLEDATVATPLCLHATQCPPVTKTQEGRAATGRAGEGEPHG